MRTLCGALLGFLAVAIWVEVAVADAAGDALLTAREVGPRWDVVEEVPGSPERDPDLVAWGVRAMRARHYTRSRGGSSEVCSIEIWDFESEAAASAAEAGMAYPGWQFSRAGTLLIMVRALRLTPGMRPRRDVFEDCRDLGDRTTRAAVSAQPHGADPPIPAQRR